VVLSLLPCALGEFVELNLEAGIVIGRTVRNNTKPVQSFLGVPFAAPPIGEVIAVYSCTNYILILSVAAPVATAKKTRSVREEGSTYSREDLYPVR
jgi:hypothetical protein